MGGSIGAYATDNATPKIPFWLMVFKNIRVFLLGSDDFPMDAKVGGDAGFERRASGGVGRFRDRRAHSTC